MKTLKIVALSALIASMSLAADPASLAKDIANKDFELNKNASALMQKIQDICKQKRELHLNATKDLSPEQMEVFKKELKYQHRQNMAKIGKDEVYFGDVCKMGKKAKKPRKGAANMPCATGECPMSAPAKPASK